MNRNSCIYLGRVKLKSASAVATTTTTTASNIDFCSETSTPTDWQMTLLQDGINQTRASLSPSPVLLPAFIQPVSWNVTQQQWKLVSRWKGARKKGALEKKTTFCSSHSTMSYEHGLIPVPVVQNLSSWSSVPICSICFSPTKKTGGSRALFVPNGGVECAFRCFSSALSMVPLVWVTVAKSNSISLPTLCCHRPNIPGRGRTFRWFRWCEITCLCRYVGQS